MGHLKDPKHRKLGYANMNTSTSEAVLREWTQIVLLFAVCQVRLIPLLPANHDKHPSIYASNVLLHVVFCDLAISGGGRMLRPPLRTTGWTYIAEKPSSLLREISQFVFRSTDLTGLLYHLFHQFTKHAVDRRHLQLKGF
jgi:hypothetical protein